MAETNVNLQVQFASFAADTPFELVIDDPELQGSYPIGLYWISDWWYYYRAWEATKFKKVPDKQTNVVLVVQDESKNQWFPLEKISALGKKRIKIFCSLADTQHIKIKVDNGETTRKHVELKTYWTWGEWESRDRNGQMPDGFKSIFTLFSKFSGKWSPFADGFVFWDQYEYYYRIVTQQTNYAKLISRTTAPITEAITWNGEQRKRLKYFYDEPSVEVIQKTSFIDKNGDEIAAPVYDQAKGEFFTTDIASGAIVVRYSPGFSVYEITYDAGESIASDELWQKMQWQWMWGDIKKANVPPVQLIILSNKKAVVTSFEREFAPNGWYEIRSQKMLVPNFNDSSTDWNDIKLPFDRKFLNSPISDKASITDVANPEGRVPKTDAEKNANVLYDLTEVAGTRKTVTTKVYDPSDNPPTNDTPYVEVKKTIYLEAVTRDGQVFKIRMLNE